MCRGCGAYTQPRNGKGDAYEYCKACHPGAAIRRVTRGDVRDAMRRWRSQYGAPPSSYDWSRTHAGQRGGEALARLSEGAWPAPGDGDRSLRDVGRGPSGRVSGRFSQSRGGFSLRVRYLPSGMSKKLTCPEDDR